MEMQTEDKAPQVESAPREAIICFDQMLSRLCHIPHDCQLAGLALSPEDRRALRIALCSDRNHGLHSLW